MVHSAEGVRRGDVWMASYVFPHERGTATSESGVSKERPIVVDQNNKDNDSDSYPIVLPAPVTTKKTNRVYEQDVLLPAGEANLRHESKVLLGLTQPFLKTRLGRRLGCLSPEKMRQVDLKLLRLLGFLCTGEDRGS